MKTYEQFQYDRLDESIVGKAAGIVNRAMSGAKRIGAGTKNMLSKTTTPSVNQPPKPKRPFQAAAPGPNKRKPFQPKPTPAARSNTAPNIPSASVSGIKTGAKRLMRNPNVKSAVRTGANMVRNVASNLRGKTYEGGGLTKQFTNKSGIGQAVKQGISDTKVTTPKGGLAQSTVGQRLNRVFNKKPNELKARALGQKFKKKFAAQDAEKAAKAKEAQKVSIKAPKDDDNASGPKVTTGRGPKTPPSTPTGAQEKTPSRKIDKKMPTDTKVNVSGKNPQAAATPKKPRKNRVSPDSQTAQAERMPNKYDRLDAKTGERVYTGPGRKPGSKNKPKKRITTQITPPRNTNKKKNEQGIGSKVADGAKKVVSNVGNAAKDKAKEVAGNVGNAAKNVASDVGNAAKDKAKEVATNVTNAAKNKVKKVASNVGNAAKDKAKEVASNVTTAAKNKTKELVASGKKKRDASRKATKAKVTTNYTEPKKGEEMKVPEKKDKVTVNTSKDTANASERIIKAMDKQGKKDETNPVQQAKKDSKTSTALTGSTLDRTKKDLKNILNLGSGSSGSGKKNTQLKDMDDDTLARQSQDSDTGKFRRNASSSKTTKNKKYNPPSKTKSQNIQTQSVINQSRKKNENAPRKPKGEGASSGGGNQRENINPKKKKIVNLKQNKNDKNKQTNESFSHWREQFLWEVDKKYPDKMKEIKPMSGKNTITINPEDESSKYKRGY